MGHGLPTSTEPIPSYIRAVIFDVDGTVKERKPVAEYVGEDLLKRELRKCHFRTFLNGYRGAKKVKEMAENNGIKGKAQGLKKFFEVVIDNIDLDKKTLYDMTKKALVENEIYGFSKFIHKLQRKGVSTFFSTVSYDTVGGSERMNVKRINDKRLDNIKNHKEFELVKMRFENDFIGLLKV